MRGRTPPDARYYAVGDIHGCDEALLALLDEISAMDAGLPDVKTRELIFLGDYIDRGPGSAEVIDILLYDLPDGFTPVFLKGNHEVMMLDALARRRPAQMWLFNGGKATLLSYGVQPDANEFGEMNYDLLLKRMRKKIAGAHQSFYEELKLFHRIEGYCFVHAGVSPDYSLDDQSVSDLLWIREPFLSSTKEYEAVIVHGHTPVSSAQIKNNRIGIDTGAVYNGKLTAIMLEGEERQFISVNASRSA